MDRGKTFEAAIVLMLLGLGALLYASMADSAPVVQEQWNVSSISPTAYTYAGDDGMLYIFDGNDIYAVSDGSLQWKYSVPANWSVINLFYDIDIDPYVRQYYKGPVFASAGGVLYLYACPDRYVRGGHLEESIRESWGGLWNESASDEKIMAISNGTLVWERQMPKGTHEYAAFGSTGDDSVGLSISGDRLYVFHAYNLTVLRTDGTALWSIPDVSCPPAVDEDGHVYVMTTTPIADNATYMNMFRGYTPYPGYSVPSGIVRAYSPDGSLLWSQDIGEPVRRPVIDPACGRDLQTLPLYHGGMLFVPLYDGVAALDRNGSILWTCHVSGGAVLYDKMPFGPDGDIYLASDNGGYRVTYPHADIAKYFHNYQPPLDRKISSVKSDGTYVTVNESYKGLLPVAASDGIAYYVTSALYDPDRPAMDELLSWTIVATDMNTGNLLWTGDIQPGTAARTKVNESNTGWIFYDNMTQTKMRAYIDWHPSAWKDNTLNLKICGDATQIGVLPRGDNVYVSYYSLNYEYPTNYESMDSLWLPRYPGDLQMIDIKGQPYFAIINRSYCAYASGIMALDSGSGSVRWQKPTNSYVTGMAANNSTIFYGTKTGGLTATSGEIAAGFALLAAAYVFLRFFLVGSVARARSRLEQNENRNAILKLIREHPGLTMRDIARELDMNMGTTRYHLLILAVNHRIREYKDGKYVRLFAGSSTYTGEEVEIISLLRREPVRRLMAAIRGKPGISNAELAGVLGLSEAAVSNYMRELSGRGFVEKESTGDGRVAYFIKRERAEKIASSLELQ